MHEIKIEHDVDSIPIYYKVPQDYGVARIQSKVGELLEAGARKIVLTRIEKQNETVST